PFQGGDLGAQIGQGLQGGGGEHVCPTFLFSFCSGARWTQSQGESDSLLPRHCLVSGAFGRPACPSPLWSDRAVDRLTRRFFRAPGCVRDGAERRRSAAARRAVLDPVRRLGSKLGKRSMAPCRSTGSRFAARELASERQRTRLLHVRQRLDLRDQALV